MGKYFQKFPLCAVKKYLESNICFILYMPPDKNYTFILSYRRWKCEPKSRQPWIKFRLPASIAAFYQPDLIQAPQGRKVGKGLTKTNKQTKNMARGLGKSISWQAVAVSICSCSIKWPSLSLPCRFPLVPVTAHLSSLCLRSFSELTEGPHVIRRGQPGVGEGTRLTVPNGTSESQTRGHSVHCSSVSARPLIGPDFSESIRRWFMLWKANPCLPNGWPPFFKLLCRKMSLLKFLKMISPWQTNAFFENVTYPQRQSCFLSGLSGAGGSFPDSQDSSTLHRRFRHCRPEVYASSLSWSW